MQNILHKYRKNIKEAVNKVSISPKDYKNPEAFQHTKSWRVYVSVNVNGKQKQKKFQTYYINGMRVNLNKSTTHAEKVENAEMLRDAVKYKIQNNPLMIVLILYGKKKAKEKYPELFEIAKRDSLTIEQAFDQIYEMRSKENLSNSRISQLRTFKNRFLDSVDESKHISELTKKDCLDYLSNYKSKAAKTFNNEKECMNNYLDNLVQLDYIEKNYVASVKNETVKPSRNEPFDKETFKKIWGILENHPVLKFYCIHVYYGLLRPVTINRIKVGDIDTKNKRFKTTDTKTGKFPKVMTKKLMEVYETLDLSDSDKLIFGKKELISEWDSGDNVRRSYYTKWFNKVVKKPLNLGENFGIYSFRHNGHLNFYNNYTKILLSKGEDNIKSKAFEKIMLYTNKKTEKEVETYLRDIEKVYDPNSMFDYGKYID